MYTIPKVVNMFIAGLSLVLIVIGVSFSVGYYVGTLQPRAPTFSESVMKANETAVLNHTRRCKK